MEAESAAKEAKVVRRSDLWDDKMKATQVGAALECGLVNVAWACVVRYMCWPGTGHSGCHAHEWASDHTLWNGVLDKGTTSVRGVGAME